MGASSSSNVKYTKLDSVIDETPKMNAYSVPSETYTTCKMETFVISHHAKIECHSQLKHLRHSLVNCGTFDLAGHWWTIFYYPDEMQCHAPFSIELITEPSSIIQQNVSVSLIYPKGTSCKVAVASWDTMYYRKSDYESIFEKNNLERNNLDISDYLEDDCLSFEFMIRAVMWSPTEVVETETKSYLSAPCSNLNEHLGQLLVNGEGTDVTIEVYTGSTDNFIEIFTAHKSVLAARSPVFKAQLFGSTTKSESDCISIEDVDASVFRTILHFIYKDELPHTNFSFGMTQKLFVAADMYKLGKLKQLCEDKLCAGINSEMATGILVWAEKHNCEPLKKACLQFLL